MEAVEHGRVAVEGGQVAYRVYGTGSRALLCLHGGPGCPSSYLDSIADLASDDLRVVFYDQLGCGSSEAPDDRSLWTLERFVREVEQVRSALDLGRIDLLGHSFGGMLAQEWALAHPAELRTLILSSTTCSVALLRDELGRLLETMPAPERDALRAGAGAPGHREAFDTFHRRHLCRIPFPEPVRRALDSFAEPVYSTLWGPDAFTIEGALSEWDVCDRLDEIGAPTLITVGGFDEVTPTCAERIRVRISGSELVVFPSSAHLAHWEERGAFMACMRGFLQNH
ncbi:MAG: proline iminopeptidase [Gaiellales bacterium]|jgi:proline iminopeptidase|nr:proline iminopeptidase [Gaiellales bacterium]